MIEHLSYSSISTYLLCPRAWKYRYIEKVKTPTSASLIFGSAIHAGIEGYIRQQHEGAIAQSAERLFELDFARRAQEEEINWGDDSQVKLAETGRILLQAAPIRAVLQAIRPLVLDGQICMEKRVEMRVPGVPIPIIGYIDLIGDDGVPCDFKTAARKWDSTKAQEETQPTFYLAALNQAGYSLNPALKFRHYVFTKTKIPGVQVIETTRTIKDMFTLFANIAQAWQDIQADRFPCVTTGWKCSPKYCEYWQSCQGA